MKWIDQYLNWGISIFPLKERDKKPLLAWQQYQQRHPTREEIEAWRGEGHKNWGAICGSISDNLLVIDIDRAELFEKLGLVDFAKETFTVRTGKGYHVYMKLQSPMKRKSLMWDGKEELRFQGEGSYVVMCGSIHPTGRRYDHFSGSPFEIKRYPVSIVDDIEKRWERYHGIDKIEEKGVSVARMTRRRKNLEEYKRKLGMSVIERFVKPVRRYGRYWQGICPFHKDTDPSFTVYEDSLSWYCFGCQKYGDVISFIQLFEGLDFISAVKKLEELTGIEFFKFEKKGESEEVKISHSAVAEMILSMHDFITIRDNEEILWWDGKKWCFEGEVRIKELCQKIMKDIGGVEKVKTHLVNEVIAFIQRETYFDRERLNRHRYKIPFLNGVYDVETGDFLPPSKEFYFTYCLPVEFDPDADCPSIKKFLKDILAEEDIPVLLEFIGYCLLPIQCFHKALFLVGDGANGKSTLINLIKRFLGSGNTTSVSLQSLLENRFAAASLYGKLANLYADLPQETLRRTGIFKIITGGDPMTVEKKFKNPFEFQPTCKLIFSANMIPRTLDDTSAFFRRWIILNFPNRFEGDKRDPYILDKITTHEELSGFFNLVLKHLRLLLKRGEFSTGKSSEEIREDYIRKSDPVLAYIMDYKEKGFLVEDSEAYVSKDDFYEEFVKYCNKNKLPAVDKSVFGRLIKRALPQIRETRKEIDGKRKTCWAGITLFFPSVLKIRVLEDVPSFVYTSLSGSTEEISLKKGDVVSLPCDFAQILLKRGVAEEV